MNLNDIVKNAKITSNYGQRFHPIKNKLHFHQGVDIVGNLDIRTPYDGTVVKVYKYGVDGKSTYGNYIIIRHQINGTTYETLYAHLSQHHVRNGERVKKGQKIGTMGKTGSATGVHLHLELHSPNYIYKNGDFPNKLNPVTTNLDVKEKAKTGYTGTSLVDYLKSIGKDSSFKHRKQIATEKGISNYKGTTEQNTRLLKLLRGY